MNFIYIFSWKSISKYFRGGETNIYIYIYLRANLNFFILVYFLFYFYFGGKGGNGPPLPWGRSVPACHASIDGILFQLEIGERG